MSRSFIDQIRTVRWVALLLLAVGCLSYAIGRTPVSVVEGKDGHGVHDAESADVAEPIDETEADRDFETIAGDECICTSIGDCLETFCPQNNACNSAACVNGVCVFTCLVFGNVIGSAHVTLDDILCVVTVFGTPDTCPNGDISPCGGDGINNVADILAVLDAFGGKDPCDCTEGTSPGGGVPPRCGSNEP